MDAQGLINMLARVSFETKEEWVAFSEKAYAIFDTLPEEDKNSIIEDKPDLILLT